MATTQKKVDDKTPTFNGKPIYELSQAEFDNGYMANLPVSFGSPELNKRLDEAIENIKNGCGIEVKAGELDNYLDSL